MCARVELEGGGCVVVVLIVGDVVGADVLAEMFAVLLRSP